ncbi:beta-propeller fold lactonase family protein [Kitasatospora sp. GAS204B]|uniref:lactonase family protein n=1 Tax=unclassified Kitasatospora TaxID=2633591 RepID=UPI00247533D2|nr:beta-propeller fold lactonase family protein [Kitasatospora sp. GAS204B]MDH6116216.1 6-phosphogluconolactonase (cycloisomerase 2 family) [Kitasatospora sp. GAS204B]
MRSSVLRSVTALAAAAGFALAGLTLAAGSASAASGAPVFVQSDAPGGNTVVAYARGWDGSLHQTGVYPTGGKGGVLQGSAADHLASQGSLAYDARHHLLYAVNAGSDTVTVFAVHGDRLTRTQVIDAGGSFPAGVALHGDQVYVLDALGGGSVQGFERVGGQLRAIAGWHRSLGLDPAATPQFTHTPGQLAVTPDGRDLVVTTKAGGQSIDVFPLGHDGAPAAAPVVNAEPGAVPFGFVFDAHGRLLVTEVGPETVASYTVGHDGRLTALGQVPTGQAGTCWLVGAGDKVYASNAGSASLSGFRADEHGTLTALGNTATDPGTVDAAVAGDGRYLYVQTGGQGVVDEFRVHADGGLTRVGSVTVPDGMGGEGIVAL